IRVVLVDSFVRGRPNWLDGLSMQDLELHPHDITTPLPEDIGDFEYVIHAASIASPTYYRLHPIETMDANVTGLRLLLDRARQSLGPLRGLLYMSTSEVYGDPPPEEIPTPETYRGNVSFTGPRACYDESKRFGETLCVNFAQQYGMPISIARPFNNYGPGLKLTDKRVLPDFARDVLADRDIALLSSGTATRTFCYTADAVVGYFKILTNGGQGEAYNIGMEEPEISMTDLAELVVELGAELFGYQGKVVRSVSDDSEYLVDNPERRCPDISKARRELGFTPEIGLSDGLRRSLIWYEANQDGTDA
ncbi:MAG: NAD-dependent epimerase/dehydratase family protein, partial [Acidimicrobiia bacterium]|nr:NAD-dependent epimerase/dehydratase family protein [Acidimicrobiia bacterium]